MKNSGFAPRSSNCRRSGVSALLFVLLAAAFSLPAAAQQSLLPGQVRSPGERPVQQLPEQTQQGQVQISQRQALDLARARYPGNVISINEVRSRNSTMRYRIRLDNEGNIITVYVDSQTGKVTRE